MLKSLLELVQGGMYVLTVVTWARLLYLPLMGRNVDETTLLLTTLILSYVLIQGSSTGTRT